MIDSFLLLAVWLRATCVALEADCLVGKGTLLVRRFKGGKLEKWGEIVGVVVWRSSGLLERVVNFGGWCLNRCFWVVSFHVLLGLTLMLTFPSSSRLFINTLSD
eukprot:m.113206 g.113206  ORF g.113206 m.113206 type:complete len:104 (-) comp12798_c1_seq4:232-543(-)